MLNKNMGYALVTAICAYGVFFPMHFIGINWFCQDDIIPIPLFDDLQDVNVLITTFALVGGVFQLFSYLTSFIVCFMVKNQCKIHGDQIH
jgi:cytochrome c oxidase subunit 1